MTNAVSPLAFDHFDVSTITDSFQLVTDTGLSASCSTLRIINVSNVAIIISFDGINDHDCIRIDRSANIMTSGNSRGDNKIARFKKGQKIWVRKYFPEKFPAGMIYFCGVH